MKSNRRSAYGERVPGLVIDGRAVTSGVVDERQVRAAAGLTLALGGVAFVYASFANIYWPIRIVTIIFFLDFVLRVSYGLKHSILGRISAFFTWGRPPQWVSAKPKRFAWSIGIVMALAMAIITNSGIRGTLPLTICTVCLVLMWLEAVLGLCLGCEIYAVMQRRGWVARDKDIEICADGVCALPGRGSGQAPSPRQQPFTAAVVSAPATPSVLATPSTPSSLGRTSAGDRPHPERLLNLRRTVRELAEARQNWRASNQRNVKAGTREFPSTEALGEFVEGLRGALFPMRLGPADLRQENEDFYVGHTLDRVLRILYKQVRLELRESKRRLHRGAAVHASDDAAKLVQAFAESLPKIRELLDSDTVAAYTGDPAAHSVDEVLLCYPAVRATASPTCSTPRARRSSRACSPRSPTVRPASTSTARIGPRLFIDHGTGRIRQQRDHRPRRARVPGSDAGGPQLPRGRARQHPQRRAA